MPSIKTQDLYRVVITESAGIAASGDVDFTVSVAPTRTNGFLVLSPENATSREVVYFHNVIGNRIYVRGVNRRSPKLHPANDSVQMNDVEDIFNYYSDMVSPLFYMEKTGTLDVRVWGGTVLVNRTQVTVADTNLTLTDNATNYIVYDYLTNVVSVNTTGVGLVKVTVTVTSGIIGTPTYNVIKESYADPYVPDLALVAPAVQNQQWIYATATGAVNTFEITLTPAIASYQVGQKFTFKANLANTGTATLNVNGLGAKTIKKLGGTAILVSGDIAINQMVEVEYNGTDFDMQSPIANAPITDINGQTQKTTPIGADEALISDSEASWINKKVLLKDMVMISEQTAQSEFTGDSDLFVVKQASGGLRKMTVADVRNAILRTGYNAPAAIAVYLLSGANNTYYYSSSVASGTNKGGLISATFVADNQNGYTPYVYAIIQTSPDNSTWTTVWSDNWTTYSSGGDPPLTSVRSVTQVYDALYVRIGVKSDNVAAGGRIKGYATVNLIK